jgi:hypothetical protein
MCDPLTLRVRALNDRARATFTDCRVVLTRGVADLDPALVREVLRRVRAFDGFTPSNDPYGEHDFGAFTVAEHEIFWKIDYYDVDLVMRSTDPSDPTVTQRVLTIMLAEEY